MKTSIQAVFGAKALCLYALSVASPAFAAPILYGDFDDFPPGVVVYTEVREDSATDDIPLYGPPEAIVNRLDFDPTAFGAYAGGPGINSDTTDGQLNFMIDPLPGTGVTSFLVSESGSFSLFGPGGAGTAVGYGVLVEVSILEIDGVSLGTPIDFTVNTSGSMDLTAGMAIASPWSLSLPVTFAPYIPANSFVTLAEVVVNNTLVATSEAGSTAFIDKKDFFIDPTGDLDPDNVIPEPTAAVLAGLALAGFAARRR